MAFSASLQWSCSRKFESVQLPDMACLSDALLPITRGRFLAAQVRTEIL